MREEKNGEVEKEEKKLIGEVDFSNFVQKCMFIVFSNFPFSFLFQSKRRSNVWSKKKKFRLREFCSKINFVILYWNCIAAAVNFKISNEFHNRIEPWWSAFLCVWFLEYSRKWLVFSNMWKKICAWFIGFLRNRPCWPKASLGNSKGTFHFSCDRLWKSFAVCFSLIKIWKNKKKYACREK